MDVTITKSLLTALRLEAVAPKPFYGNTNVVGLIDAIIREIDTPGDPDTDTDTEADNETCPDYAAAYERRVARREAYRAAQQERRAN